MGKKILVVDDSRTARQQVSNALLAAGYQVVEAVDGVDGLAKIELHSDASLVICDVNMPNLDGLQVLAALRARSTSDVPVMMLTTESHPELLQQAKKAGAKGWIVKPFKPEMLVAAVRKLVGDT
jgi:two-component system, chemotaxis family, chemotaxis protein CheY